MKKGKVVLFGPSTSGGEILSDCPVIGFAGRGESGFRRVDEKKKAKNRKKRKLASNKKRR